MCDVPRDNHESAKSALAVSALPNIFQPIRRTIERNFATIENLQRGCEKIISNHKKTILGATTDKERQAAEKHRQEIIDEYEFKLLRMFFFDACRARWAKMSLVKRDNIKDRHSEFLADLRPSLKASIEQRYGKFPKKGVSKCEAGPECQEKKGSQKRLQVKTKTKDEEDDQDQKAGDKVKPQKKGESKPGTTPKRQQKKGPQERPQGETKPKHNGDDEDDEDEKAGTEVSDDDDEDDDDDDYVGEIKPAKGRAAPKRKRGVM